jgi:hypothetical protein
VAENGVRLKLGSRGRKFGLLRTNSKAGGGIIFFADFLFKWLTVPHSGGKKWGKVVLNGAQALKCPKPQQVR